MRAPIEIFSYEDGIDRALAVTIEAAMQKPEYLCLTLPEAEAKEAERAASLSERPRSMTSEPAQSLVREAWTNL